MTTKLADVERYGEAFGKGLFTALQKAILPLLIVWLVLTLLVSCFSRDDTDGAFKVSGVRLRTDARTGCQYLETRDGGITPRLRDDGRQICKGRI